MSHLEEGLLHALLDGEIPSEELSLIQAHLASCPECRARLEQERQLLAEAAGLVEGLEVPAGAPAHPPASQPSGPRHWGRRLAWAASLLAAVGLGYAARGAPVELPKPQEVVAAPEQRTDSAVGGIPASPATASVRAPAPPTTAVPQRRRPKVSQAAPREAAKTSLAQQEQKASADRLEEVVVTGRMLPESTAGAAVQPKAAPAPTSTSAAADRAAAPAALGRLREASGAFAQLNASRQPLLAAPEPINLPDAVRRLGGSLRLVDGLVPLRLEAQGQTIRVVYALAQGELVLSQQLIDGRVVFQLMAPPGFPADSLGKLRSRVRE